MNATGLQHSVKIGSHTMKVQLLNIGEMYACRGPVMLKGTGIGSCICLFLIDPLEKVYGGAHLFVAESVPGKFPGVEESVDLLLRKMASAGSSLQHIRAKIAGGAGLYTKAGKQNIEKLLPELRRRKIYVASADVGGAVSRSVIFNSEDEAVNIINSNRLQYSI